MIFLRARVGLVVFLFLPAIAYAAPTLQGNKILWPENGWYQVQRLDNFESVCEGKSPNSSSLTGGACVAEPGRYVVINHSSGERYYNIVVPEKANTSEITVSDNIISWPDDGWYQVQSALDYVTYCQGGVSCAVPVGEYIVINHTSGKRFEGVEVSEKNDGSSPNDGGYPFKIIGNTIIFLDGNWYQVQKSKTYESVCQGTRSCSLENGIYLVINHTTGERFESVSVKSDTSKLNFVVILTDDQPASTLWAMPLLQEKLARRGVTFTNAIATNPECCPFRASALAGGYHTHNTGVLRNTVQNGTVKYFNENKSIAVDLQEAGFRTGFIGRYMHGYKSGDVPPGWDTWIANAYYGYDTYDELRSVTFYDAKSKAKREIKDVSQYVTDFHADQAVKFLSQEDERPFFLWIGLFAPHAPYLPAKEDIGKFASYVFPKTTSHQEDVSDKPEWLQRMAVAYRKNLNYQRHSSEFVPRKQLEMLQSVDRAVEKIIETLTSLGKIDETMVVFTSDNGLTYGHHGIPSNKGLAYEESLKVPLVISWPGADKRVDSSLVAANLDLGATIYDLVGIKYDGDGESLVPILNDVSPSWRSSLLIENFGFLEWLTNDSPIWAGVRTDDYKYVLHSSGEQELYDLNSDPEELNSLHADETKKTVMKELELMTRETIGLAIVERYAPAGRLLVSYEFFPKTFGGIGPFSWKVTRGSLPVGLDLNTNNGNISGTPLEAGTYSFTIEVTGSRLQTHSGKPESFRRAMTIDIADR